MLEWRPCIGKRRAVRPPTRWVVDGRAMDVQRWPSHLTAGRYDDDDDDDHYNNTILFLFCVYYPYRYETQFFFNL